jgi:integrase
MKGSVRRRCTICGSRNLNKTGKSTYTCPNVFDEGHPRAGEHHDSWTWGFVVDVSRPGEDRRQVWRSGYSTRKEAEEELAALITDRARGERVEPSKMSVAEQAEGWLARIRNEGRAESTLNSYRSNLELHVLPRNRIGTVRLQSLTIAHLDHLYAQLLEEGRADRNGGLGPRTVRYIHTIVNALLADAVRKGLLVRNPAEMASPPSAKAAKAPEGAYWTHEELAAFLRAAGEHSLWGLWRTAAFTGLRRGELCGLRWSDVDLEGDANTPGRIRVVQQYASDGAGGWRFGPPKSEMGRRSIDLDPETVGMLRRWHADQRETMVELGVRSELVFPKIDTGLPLRPDSAVSAAFDRIVRRIDVPRLSIHGLRHTHCCHLVAGGMDLKAVSTRMGHASVSFTLDRYGHLLPGQQAPVAARVAEIVDSHSVGG